MSEFETGTEPVKRRRRGSELEHALLVAAWAELQANGLGKLTMESVADRAGTGVAVLYRRWANKEELVVASISHFGATHQVAVPNTGNLRDDMVALLSNLNSEREELATFIGATFAGLRDSAGLSPQDLRQLVIGAGPRPSVIVLQRAVDRGEIGQHRIPQSVIDLPGQLVLHDILMNLRPASDERIRTIVDEIFLPLIFQNIPNSVS